MKSESEPYLWTQHNCWGNLWILLNLKLKSQNSCSSIHLSNDSYEMWHGVHNMFETLQGTFFGHLSEVFIIKFVRNFYNLLNGVWNKSRTYPVGFQSGKRWNRRSTWEPAAYLWNQFRVTWTHDGRYVFLLGQTTTNREWGEHIELHMVCNQTGSSFTGCLNKFEQNSLHSRTTASTG